MARRAINVQHLEPCPPFSIYSSIRVVRLLAFRVSAPILRSINPTFEARTKVSFFLCWTRCDDVMLFLLPNEREAYFLTHNIWSMGVRLAWKECRSREERSSLELDPEDFFAGQKGCGEKRIDCVILHYVLVYAREIKKAWWSSVSIDQWNRPWTGQAFYEGLWIRENRPLKVVRKKRWKLLSLCEDPERRHGGKL